MRVALVRGPQLNPFEMQSYAPLSARGFELTAFTSRSPQFEPPAGLKVVRLPSPMDGIASSRGIVKTVREAIAYRRGTANRLAGLEAALAGFDLIHSAETFNAFTAQSAAAAIAYEKPLVVTVWENIPFLKVAPPFQRYRERVLREADALVAVTERAKAALLLEGADEARVHVIPVGIDLARFAPGPRPPVIRARIGVPDDKLAFLFAARLTWEKGILDAIHALKLQDVWGGPAAGAHLMVMGQGDLEREARARVAALGLAERVHFLGHVPYAEVADHYRAADALVLGSVPTARWQEQYGMVLVEAMACGLPVIAAASGSITEVVGPDALLVQAGDAWSMAEAMARAAEPGTREDLSRRGRARAARLFDRESVATQFEKLYRSL